jgi:uncharacterized membrane protein (DUF2068 family)
MHSPDSRRVLRTIAIFKFTKATLLATAGVGALRLAKYNVLGFATYLVGKYHLNPGNQFVVRVLARATDITPKRLHELGIIGFVYSALFLTEGIGLWSLKRWGEWITVVITGSLLPLEIYEASRRFTLPKLAVLLLNVGIVCYLVLRLRREKVEYAHPAT